MHNLQLTQAVFGTTPNIIFGTRRTAGKLLFYGGFYATKAPNSAGKGIFGGKSQQFDYFADVQLAVGSGSANSECLGVINVWDQNGKLYNLTHGFAYTIPGGGGAYSPVGNAQPPIQADLGVSFVQPYSVSVNDYGSGGLRTLSGTQNVPLTLVTGTPASGQYAFNLSTSTYTFAAADAGRILSGTYTSVFSLYYFVQTQAAQVPATGPYQISPDNQAYFSLNLGVVRVDTGATLVQGTDYTVSSGFGGGVYTFASYLAGVYVYITYQYTSSDPSVTNSSVLNLTFQGGKLGQTPWSYMQSKYPGSALGYTGIAWVGANPMALGESASLPSYNYEVMGLAIFPGGGLDAHPCDAFRLLLTDGLLGVGFPSANIDAWTSCYEYWAANNYLISHNLDTQTSVAEAFSTIIETGNVAALWSAGLLKLIPYGDTTVIGNGYEYSPPSPAVTLTWDDMLPPSDQKSGRSGSEDPLQVSQRAPQDCWNYVQAQWLNRSNDYNNELINEQNDAFVQAYGRRIESPQTWDFITTSAAAQWALRLRLNRQCYLRNNYKFWLPYWFAALEPMDLVVLPTGETVRITEVADDPNGRLAITAEQWKYGSADVSIYPKQGPSSYQPGASQALPGLTSPVIFEASPQSVLARPNTLQIAVAGNNPNWGGCDIYVSEDGTTYVPAGPSYRVTSINRTGLLSAVLASHADPDNSDTLSVDMTPSITELVSVTAAQKDAFASLSAIVDASGSIELVSFETATLTAANRYNLTTLRRGVYGTTIGAHAIGAEFSYIGTNGVYEYQYPAQYAGKTVYFKFASFNLTQNQVQDLSTCKPYSFTVPGTSLQPPSNGGFTTNPQYPLGAQVAGSNADITIQNFTAMLNNQSVACTPVTPITGLNQGQSYWVYYIDLSFQGGNVTPIATQTLTDFQGKSGYYQLIGPNPDGSITTPTTGGGGGGAYRPTSYSSTGTLNPLNPSYAYDANPLSYAQVGGVSTGSGTLSGNVSFQGFANTTIGSSKTLSVIAATTISGSPSGPVSTIQASLNNGGSYTTLATLTTATGQTTYTLTVPSSTDLSSIIILTASSVSGGSSGAGITLEIYDINVM